MNNCLPSRYRQATLIGSIAVLAVFAFSPQPASVANSLVSEQQAQQFGLKRAWFTQVQVNPGRNAVERAVLLGDELAVLTTAGVLHVLDADTGETRWIERIGNPRYPSLGPASSDKHLAIINGSTLYVFDKEKKQEVFRKAISGGPAAGPALSGDFAFVPLFNGQIEGFHLKDVKRVPWVYQSSGRLFMRPVTTQNRVVWASDAGYLYGADSKGEGIRYRFETLSPIVAPPAAKPPYVFAVAEDGYVYALNDDTGRLRWRYATGWPARFSPVVIGDNLFVATDEPALHCLSTEDGSLRWVTTGVAQFVAASPTRVYGMDRYGGLLVLDARSGVVLGQASGREGTTAVLNQQTDRLFLVSNTGLVQCLHEVGQEKPFQHVQPEAAPTDEAAEDASAEDSEMPETPEDAPDDEPAPDAADPFNDAPDEEPEGDPFSNPSPATPPADAPEEDPFADPNF